MRIGWSAALATWVCVSSCCAAPADFMVQVTIHGKSIEGLPLAWNHDEVHLLGRDGQLWNFAPSEASDYAKTSDGFQCYSPSTFRAMLLRELGEKYEVTGTSHYMVAHPAGQRDKWAERFEALYRSFVSFFSVRGFHVQPPPFPLVGVVCSDQGQFLRYSASQGGPMSLGVLGCYFPTSNRIILYDQQTSRSRLEDWRQTASTILHEATHQTAFNTGVHNRYSPPPLWLAEGLATSFEAPGVYDAGNHPDPSERINRGRLAQFQQWVLPKHRPELLAEMIASDRLFQSHPSAAYAEAWAFTHYLLETQPQKYCTYLARTAGHAPFAEVTSGERVADFAAVFGGDWRMIEAQFLRFMAGVR